MATRKSFARAFKIEAVRLLMGVGIVLGCTVLLASCDDRDDDRQVADFKEFEILTHPEAVDIARRRFPGARAWQVDYRVKISFPKTAIDPEQKRALIELGWGECGGRAAGWQVFIDEALESRPRCVYQEISHLRKADMLLSIRHYYGDQTTENFECPDAPTNPLQTVIVAIHSYDDVEEVVGRLGLDCSRYKPAASSIFPASRRRPKLSSSAIGHRQGDGKIWMR